MAFGTRLCNPTPFKVQTYWGNVLLVIEPFSHIDLEHYMAIAYRPDSPGFESVNETIGYHGVFLLDHDKPYDVQALDHVRKAKKERQTRLADTTRNLRNERAQRGVSQDEKAMEEALEVLGYGAMKREIEILENLEKKLTNAVGTIENLTKVRQYDPERTIFVMNPITEFPSKTAMEFYLSLPENAEIAAKHTAWKLKTQNNITEASAPPNLGDLTPPPRRGRPPKELDNASEGT